MFRQWHAAAGTCAGVLRAQLAEFRHAAVACKL